MSNFPVVPELFSARRAMYISGLGRTTIESLPRHGSYQQIAKADLERLIGREITLADWDKATIAINHKGMARRSENEAA